MQFFWGGVSALAEVIFENNGYVFGAVLDTDFTARHISVNDPISFGEIRGSKYVQSDTGNTYKDVKALLDDQNYVLYTGTPCQIAGLKSYLGKEYEKLICADILCHGVSSPVIFQKYIGWLKEKEKTEISKYLFRSKRKCGWGHSAGFENKSGYKEIKTCDPYLKCYMKSYLFRKCCYKCKYVGEKRCSDFTFGDFWGIQSIMPDFYNPLGVSAMLVNTEKAVQYLDKLQSKLYLCRVGIEDIKKRNEHLRKPANCPKERSSVYSNIDMENDYLYIEKNLNQYITLKEKIIGIIPSVIKYAIKRMLRKM